MFSINTEYSMDIIFLILLSIAFIVPIALNIYLLCIFLTNMAIKFKMQKDVNLIERIRHITRQAEEDSYKGYQ
jgi:hypothetical protein